MSKSRLMGNALGIFLLASALSVNMFSGNALKPLNSVAYFTFVFVYIVMCIPLLFPLAVAKRHPKFVYVLLAILTLDTIYFFCKSLKDFYWSLSSVDILHQIATFIVGFVTVFVLLLQYSQIRNRKAEVVG